MPRRKKILWGCVLMGIGVVLAHVSFWLSTVPHHQRDALYQILLADSIALAFAGYLWASWGVIVDD